MNHVDHSQFDKDVERLASVLSELARRQVAAVLEDCSLVYDCLYRKFPPHLGGIDWNRAVCAWSSASIPNEPENSVLERVLTGFNVLCNLRRLTPRDKVVLLSDDLYSCGLECEIAFVPRVLEEWLPLPHAVFVVPADMSTCLHVAFVRSVYVAVATNS